MDLGGGLDVVRQALKLAQHQRAAIATDDVNGIGGGTGVPGCTGWLGPGSRILQQLFSLADLDIRPMNQSGNRVTGIGTNEEEVHRKVSHQGGGIQFGIKLLRRRRGDEMEEEDSAEAQA